MNHTTGTFPSLLNVQAAQQISNTEELQMPTSNLQKSRCLSHNLPGRSRYSPTNFCEPKLKRRFEGLGKQNHIWKIKQVGHDLWVQCISCVVYLIKLLYSTSLRLTRDALNILPYMDPNGGWMAMHPVLDCYTSPWGQVPSQKLA